MADLLAAGPLDGLDVATGGCRMVGWAPGRLTWLAPYPGAEGDLAGALEAAHGVAFPAPGAVVANDGVTILWSGRAQALLVGPDPAEGLAAHGAVLDVTEVWAGLRLTGPDTAEVLARLVPLDLRRAALPVGRTARTMLGHLNVQAIATPEGIDVLAMRSMARTAAHEIEAAMLRVAARAALPG